MIPAYIKRPAAVGLLGAAAIVSGWLFTVPQKLTAAEQTFFVGGGSVQNCACASNTRAMCRSDAPSGPCNHQTETYKVQCTDNTSQRECTEVVPTKVCNPDKLDHYCSGVQPFHCNTDNTWQVTGPAQPAQICTQGMDSTKPQTHIKDCENL